MSHDQIIKISNLVNWKMFLPIRPKLANVTKKLLIASIDDPESSFTLSWSSIKWARNPSVSISSSLSFVKSIKYFKPISIWKPSSFLEHY